MRSIQFKATQEEKELIQDCKTMCLFKMDGSDYIYHVGSSYDYRSICDGGLIAERLGIRREGRKTCFFSAVDPIVATMLTLRFEENEPRAIPSKLRWRPAQNAVFWFEWRPAQHKGLEFCQTISNAILLYDSMPPDCLVKVVKRNLDDTEADILHEKEQLEDREVHRVKDEPIEAWKNKIRWCLENRYLKDLNRIDGEPMKFEWKIFQGFTTLGILEEIQKFMTELQCEPEQYIDRIIFMSMYNDIVCEEQGNTEKYEDGEWDKTAERMVLNLAESRHPIFRATSDLARGELRSKAKEKKSIHFNGSEENIEMILRTIISANKLSIYGAVADLC